MGGQWSTSDAWVFAAIAGAPRTEAPPAWRLAEVIRNADVINHALLLEEGFTKAIGRLTATGLIDAEPVLDHYRPTQAGLALRRNWRHGLFGWSDHLLPALRRLGPPVDADWSLPNGAFDAAVREYQDRADHHDR